MRDIFVDEQVGRFAARQEYVAFAGLRRIASGDLQAVVLAAKRAVDDDGTAGIFVFSEGAGRPVDVDFSGTEDHVRARVAALRAFEPGSDSSETVVSSDERPPSRGRGRPRLGVVSREVTLLPQHWGWLNSQPGGASATLRRLVHEARRTSAGRDRVRHARETTYRFSIALAGDAPRFEEAMRALFAGDADNFISNTDAWPADVRDYARHLAAPSFAPSNS